MKTSALVVSLVLAMWVHVMAVNPWEPVEISFEAEGDYNWWEFPLTVDFELDGNEESAFVVEGYWDGGKRWVVRTAFPVAGHWKWVANSSDAGMQSVTGEIHVSPVESEQLESNPNLRGSIGISKNGRYFSYADGTPFFMLASTLWAGNTARCGLGEKRDGPFYQHLANRKARGFTTILMQYFHGYGDYPESLGHRNEGGYTYTNIETKQLNPEHFKFLDIRMRSLWEQGFVVAIPTTWWGKTKNCVFTPEDARRMSAYCAVRYGAFNAIWSLSGEYQYAFQDCDWTAEDFNFLGDVVQRHNPFNRPLSIHPSGRTNWDPPHNVLSSLPFHGESWLDHHWLQTGQGRDRLFNIVTRLEENRRLSPVMPIFCSEAFYERKQDAEAAYHSRWQVWTAFLNGAAGFGYGAFGLWQFYDPQDPTGETGKYSGRENPWYEAQEFEGASQLIHARSLLTEFDWWNLEPARGKIMINGNPNPIPSADDLSPPQAATFGEDTWVVYIPRGNKNRSISIKTHNRKSGGARWVNPRDGSKGPQIELVYKNGLLELPGVPDSEEDWVWVVSTAEGP